MKHWYRLLPLIAAASGIYLSVMYINPYNGKIMLSEAILQISGSRGIFVLGFSYSELASFAMRLFPTFILELYTGIMLYQHFCTAGIYIFSRYPHRVKWYIREVCRLFGAVCFFNLLLLAVTILTAMGRYEVQIDSTGIILTLYHFIIYSIWEYIMSLLVNLIAIYSGSNTAYVSVVSIQLVFIVLLNLTDLFIRYFDNKLSHADLLIWNPIAHLVLGWRSDLYHSPIVFLLFGSVVTFAGALVIGKHDLLVSDIETEAV